MPLRHSPFPTPHSPLPTPHSPFPTPYPDAGDSADACSYVYNRQGERTGFTDQNGTVHAYAIDKLGRTTADSVTTLGLNVDDAVRRIETEFDVQSRPVTVTSFSTPEPVSESSSSSGDTAVNQIAYTYDPFGQLATEAQEHAGPVEGSTPVVTYTRADGSAGTARLTRITYPNGRNVDFDYGAADSDISTPVAIKGS